MILLLDKQYVLSDHPMGAQLAVKVVAKAINTLQYCLNRWKQSKDPSVLDELVAQGKKSINESVSSLPATHAPYNVSSTETM